MGDPWTKLETFMRECLARPTGTSAFNMGWNACAKDVLGAIQARRDAELPVYYLAHPWAVDPDGSFKNAVLWTNILRKKDHAVLSPILHTHPYWKEITSTIKALTQQPKWDFGQKKVLEAYLEAEDWLDWDLALLGGLTHPVVLMSRTAYEIRDGKRAWLSEGCQTEYMYAMDHGIPVYELEAFLAGTEVAV